MKCYLDVCEEEATHTEHWGTTKRGWCEEHTPWSGHFEFCPDPCKALTTYSENYLDKLVVKDPIKLLELLEDSGRNAVGLSFGAEKLGDVIRRAADALIGLLKHTKSVVQEGALYGLSALLDRADEALEEIKALKERTESEVIKSECVNLLEYHGK